MSSHKLLATLFQNACLIFLALSPLNIMAQSYNFTFYNGDVTVDPNADKNKVNIKTDGIEKVEITEGETPTAITAPPQKEEAPTIKTTIAKEEKLKRTGISLITGYNHSSFRNSELLLGDSKNQVFRAGISLISSYDFSIDIQFLSNTLEAQTSFDRLDGSIPGLSLGISNNYWLANSFGLSLAADVRAMRGKTTGKFDNYKYESYGAGLSFGPTFEFENIQFLLAYEYGIDNVKITSNSDTAASYDDWAETSAVKASVKLRF